MHRKQRMKKFLSLIAGSLLVACTSCPSPAPVHCHKWQENDAKAIKSAIASLAQDSPLHGIIRDYERVCLTLK